MDLKRLSEEPFLEITPSRNNIIIRFTNRPADAKPTSNRPVQFSILYLLTSLTLFFIAHPGVNIVFYAEEIQRVALITSTQ